MMREVEVANHEAIDRKEGLKVKEKDEEQAIVNYNKKRVQREEEKAAEDARVREDKEREIQRLRELQEKA